MQIAEHFERQLQIACQILFAELRRGLGKSLLLAGRSRHQPGGTPGDLDHQQVPDVAGQLAGEMLQAAAVRLELRHHVEHPARIPGCQRLRHLLQRIERKHPQQPANFPGFELRSATRDRLIERGERIPHAALARLRQDAQHLVVRLDALLFHDPFHARHHVGKIDGAEAELLAARDDGHRNFVRLRGAEDKNHPFRRLLQGLEQGVEGFVGDLVRFVDDEYFVAAAGRAIADILAQFAHFIDTAVGRGVDLDHVHR